MSTDLGAPLRLGWLWTVSKCSTPGRHHSDCSRVSPPLLILLDETTESHFMQWDVCSLPKETFAVYSL